jgi:hypothetical protein
MTGAFGRALGRDLIEFWKTASNGYDYLVRLYFIDVRQHASARIPSGIAIEFDVETAWKLLVFAAARCMAKLKSQEIIAGA